MSSNIDTHVATYGSENSKDIWYRQPFLWKDASKRANYKAGPYTFELDSYNKTVKDAETQKADQNSMYNWYKNLIEIKSLYGKNSKVEFHSSSSNNVMVLKVNGPTKLVIYINIGTGTANYQMNPDEIAGTTTTFYKAMGGAPQAKGGDIGATKRGISVFKV
jgi:glycosidase